MMKKPHEVFDDHLKAIKTLNPFAVIDNYAADALFVNRESTYKGKKEILTFYKKRLPRLKSFNANTIRQSMCSNIINIIWLVKNKDVVNDVYIIINEKIQYQRCSGIIK
ncbi:hypothetical protein ATE84_0058 [Aquimarina sp. MAR_2010_214]|uniref:hypothetical protein n=1 Tax=Aquimarina sp. MAR_2010_214 TaxID=1250026 RepID=UPI000C71391A|nr:hypothetical protein [Aquimarina sp. MAR_2010_214]PKV48072.1 hypothetical protein ATE84_0058 [Aquimarina sp. MAR_2010_214]